MALRYDQHFQFDSEFYFQQNFSCGSFCLLLNTQTCVYSQAFSWNSNSKEFLFEFELNKSLKLNQNGKQVIEYKFIHKQNFIYLKLEISVEILTLKKLDSRFN